MNEYDEDDGVDAYYLHEWASFGIAELESYLLKHARFERYLGTRGTERQMQRHLARTSDPGSEED